MGIYNKLREMRPKWTEKVGIIERVKAMEATGDGFALSD